jgi:hypothetical protein
MENARAVVIHQSQQSLEKRYAALNRDVLEYYVRMNKIEAALYPGRPIVALHEANVRDTQFTADGAGFGEHGFSYVNPEYFLAAARKWDGDSPHAAAEVERSLRGESRIHACANYLPNASHILLAAFEEPAQRRICQLVSTKIRMREDRPIRLELPK